MKLFPEIERTDTSPAGYSEPRYAYLQRTARPEFAEARRILEVWFQGYPECHKPDLRSRLLSSDDRAFDSAFFELYLHELMCNMGFQIEVHPSSPDPQSKRAPDFLCTQGSFRFFLEATVLRELSDEQAAAKAREDTVYDTLDSLDSPNFFIGVQYLGSPATPPPGRKIREFLSRHLSKLEPQEYEHWSEQGGFDSLPSWQFEHDGWQLRFIAIPKSASSRGQRGVRPLGVFLPGQVSWRNDHERLREALKDKARAYGNLDAPYVIALNSQLLHIDQGEVMEALFGRESYLIDGSDASAEPKMQRKPDGLWTSPRGPRYTRVSGVVIARHVLPWNVNAMVHYCPNPWAESDLGGALNSLPHAVVSGEKYRWQPGTSPGELLGIETVS